MLKEKLKKFINIYININCKANSPRFCGIKMLKYKIYIFAIITLAT